MILEPVFGNGKLGHILQLVLRMQEQTPPQYATTKMAPYSHHPHPQPHLWWRIVHPNSLVGPIQVIHFMNIFLVTWMI